MYRHVELSRRAEKDLKRLTPAVRKRLVAGLLSGENLDIKPLAGSQPWLRLRIGEHRVLFRPLNPQEVKALEVNDPGRNADTSEAVKSAEPGGWLIARIVDRRDLDRAVASLP